MHFKGLGDVVIDNQGNAKTFAGGADARLYYIDYEGNEKKYLLEGEAAEGGSVDLKQGEGITLDDSTISIDKNIVALKNELFSGSYNDLTNRPTIPTNTSQLTNDSNFVTKAEFDEQIGDINSILDTINGEVI